METPEIFRLVKRTLTTAASTVLLSTGILAAAPSVSAHATFDVCPTGCAYSSIQQAVNSARNGAVIRIGPGTYHELVSIQGKHVSLLGVGQSTIIDANGRVNGIVIGTPTTGGTAAFTRISHLVVEHAQQAGILAQATRNLTITHTVVRDNDLATPADAATNEEDNPDYEALHLIGVRNSLIAHNTVAHNKDGGIYLTNELGATTGNQVIDNVVTDNAVDCGITLAAHVAGNAGVSHNMILNNRSARNGAAGIIIATPVPNGVATGNLVQGNTVTNNGLGGIDIHGHATGENLSNNRIIHNWISGNAPDFGTTTKPTGISIEGDSGATILRTVIVANVVSNEYYGISLVSSQHEVLQGNQISATVPIYRH